MDLWQLFQMRSFAFAIFAILSTAAPLAHAQALPPFPVMQEMEYPRDPETIRVRSDDGEGYATLVLASTTQCDLNDAACEAHLGELYRLAADRGQSAALAMLRMRILDHAPTRSSEFSVGATVCGRTRSDAPEIVRRIEEIELPGRDGQLDEWVVQEASGSLGSSAVSVSRGPIGASLIFSEDHLRLARVFTNFLSIGSRDGAFEEVQRANAAIARAVCPEWPELSDAIPAYVIGVAQSWPPQAVHADGPSTWFAATGVTPDIFWFDLYVDPLHNPFTSGGTDEQFHPAGDLGLAPPH